MALRKDLGVAYLSLLGLSVLSLFFPVPVLLHMLASCVLIIYIGSQNTLLQTESEKSDVETMARSDVYMFPIIGSCVLFSLYLIYKCLPGFVVTIFVKFYFVLSGLYVVSKRAEQMLQLVLTQDQLQPLQDIKKSIPLQTLNTTLEPYVGKVRQVYGDVCTKVEPVLAKVQPVIDKVSAMISAHDTPSTAAAAAAKADTGKAAGSNSSGNPNHLFPNTWDLNGVDIVSLSIGAVVAALYLITNHWFLANIFGICFSIQAIELINIGSYMNGALLLGGLFFYDIFWVFGTDVMVTVATKFDAPIKLIYPAEPRPSMLGLGDIVIPGVFIAYMLQIDQYFNRPHVDIKTLPKPVNVKQHIQHVLTTIGNISPLSYRTEYFNVVLIGYTFGLLFTNVILYTFKAAQPALLYLVPACLISTAGLAYFHGTDEFNTVINFSSEENAAESSNNTKDVAVKVKVLASDNNNNNNNQVTSSTDKAQVSEERTTETDKKND